MSLGPFLRSPITDLTASIVNYQQYDKCGELEMASIDCLEAYGTIRGAEKCADILSDFKECATMHVQMKRFQAMRLERHRQGLLGDRKSSEYYAKPPRIDAY
ncbi:uncharacterized protein LOC134216605 [Armigeres subalbatus]|uniref:uncharacterized protein LOC134216605 n=1 Tax=Armigeres subalbatus TaxID=124917 RepID=UPI002ED3A4D8